MKSPPLELLVLLRGSAGACGCGVFLVDSTATDALVRTLLQGRFICCEEVDGALFLFGARGPLRLIALCPSANRFF